MKKTILTTIMALSLMAGNVYSQGEALIKDTPAVSMFMNIIGVLVIAGVAYFVYDRYSKKKK